MKIVMYMKREMRCGDYKAALVGAALSLVLGILSALCGGSAIFYRCLLLPKFALPAYAFVIFWSLFYILIGGAAGIVFSSRDKCVRKRRLSGMLLFLGLQILLFFWYPLFFGAHALLASLILCAAIIAMSFFVMKSFVRVSVIAGGIMFLFLIWLSYAFLLNLCVVILN